MMPLPVWSRRCMRRLLLSVNVLEQYSHLWGLSPMWHKICVFSLDSDVNFFSQRSHLCLRRDMSGWMYLMCWLTDLMSGYCFPHCGQRNRSSGLWATPVDTYAIVWQLSANKFIYKEKYSGISYHGCFLSWIFPKSLFSLSLSAG